MSSKLWEYFFQDDVEGFQRLLARAGYGPGGQRAQGGAASIARFGSPGTAMGSSPNFSSKNSKFTGTSPGTPGSDRNSFHPSNTTLSRAELNVRDQYGRTLLHHVASSRKPTAVDFALALLEIPFLDIYAQDWESGWTPLHRALYAGNATIAQALMARDIRDATDFSKAGTSSHPIGALIKAKDREGYSPFDVYGATITSREIKRIVSSTGTSDSTMANHADSDVASSAPSVNGDDFDDDSHASRGVVRPRTNLLGDEVFTFGSNKNLNLGLGDQDDRQFPERISVTRPKHLLQRFYNEFRERQSDQGELDCYSEQGYTNDLPALIENKRIKFQDIVMSKLHTAIITNDPESNLFMCGFGPGGRLGTGDESTRFGFVCIETGGLANKKVVSVALGQDHSLAITEHGEIFSWGSNKFGQLGYSLPRSNNKNDVPMQTTPRQIFNPFKKEVILGAAASAIHSVVFSSSGLYTFGKNEGQLGLVDSDARSLEMQVTPRRVGAALFNGSIQMVSAIDHATAVLLQNHEVWVFSQFGYSKLSFPLDVSSTFIKNSTMATRYGTSVNRVVKITSGGNTICALSSFGEVFTVQVYKSENTSALTSTTNPNKTRNSLSPPVRAWSVKKSHMAARDVDVGQDGSIIICTSAGSAWKKEKRTKIKDGASKDYKFARIPGLSRVVGVRSNAFGAYAVAQRDVDVTKEQISVDPSTLWHDFLLLSPFGALKAELDPSSVEDTLDSLVDVGPAMAIKQAMLSASNIESQFLSARTPEPSDARSGIVWVKTTVSDAKIPVHEFILSGRSSVLRHAFQDFRRDYYFSMPDVLSIEYNQQGQSQILFQGVDFLTILNFIFFLYTDSVLDVWHQAKYSSENAFRYRQVRTEVMRIATHLGLASLERAARLMVEPAKCLKIDMSRAINDPAFFESGDVIVDLNGETLRVHSQVVCQRSPFFSALFNGRSGGRWLLSRRTNPAEDVHVDLKHIDRYIFEFVLRYMYADTEEQLFDEVRSRDSEEFVNLVLDVMFVANELMIDRLAQVCQKVLGRFVTTRNVCHLLNSVAPCATRDFKDAALEYICLNLEDMLANRFLEDLDEDLLGELDAVCQENQLTCFPVSRGRNSDEYVFEKYPELVSLVESDRRRRIDSMKLRARLNRVEIFDDKLRTSTPEKAPVSPAPRIMKAAARELNMTNSPVLKSTQSTSDFKFEMSDEAVLSPGPSVKGKMAIRGVKSGDLYDGRPSPESFSPALSSSLVEGGSFGDRSYLDGQMASGPGSILAQSPSESRAMALQQKKGSPSPPAAPSNAPWGSPVVSSSKKDMKDILAEASQSRVSNITLGLSGRRESSGNFAATKLSQKERKKLQQQQIQERLEAEQRAKEASQNPWQLPAINQTPVKPAPLPGANEKSSPGPPEPAKFAQRPSMTLRQTVAGTPPPLPRPKPGSTPLQTQSRSISANMQTPPRPSRPVPIAGGPSSSPSFPAIPQPAIQSVRHIPRPEPYQTSFHSPSSHSLSLAAIFMQQQTEKDEIREAATAKHNLHDIQAEQEFQEWWDKESKRVQDLAEAEAAAASPRDGKGAARGGGRGKSSAQRRRRGKAADNNNNNHHHHHHNDASADAHLASTGPSAAEHTQKVPNSRGDNHQQRAPSGKSHPHDSGNTARRGGRGGNRGKGKMDRDWKLPV